MFSVPDDPKELQELILRSFLISERGYMIVINWINLIIQLTEMVIEVDNALQDCINYKSIKFIHTMDLVWLEMGS